MTRQRLRCTAVALGLTAGCGLAGGQLSGAALGAPAASVDEALVRVCLVLLLGCTAWVWVVGLVAVVEAWRLAAAPAAPPRQPRGVVRRVVLAACGVAVSSVLVAAPGHAADQTPGGLDGLPLPQRAEGTDAAAPTSTRGPSVVVRPGDSLWDLAAAEHPGAGDATVLAATRALHAANRAVIGPDPDLIRPGQVLHLPAVHPPRQTGDPR